MKHPVMQTKSKFETTVPRSKNPKIAVQKRAVLKTICERKMGKYFKLKIMQVLATNPATLLNKTVNLRCFGTSLMTCTPEYLTVKAEIVKLIKVLNKQSSIGPTPVLVATLLMP